MAILLSYYLTILLSHHYFTIPPLHFTLLYLSSSCSTYITSAALPPSANLNCSFVPLSQMFLCFLSQTFLCFFILGFIFSLQASLQALLFAPFPVLHGSSYIFSTPRSLNYWQLLSTDLHREPRISIFCGPFLQFTWTGGLFYLMSVLLNVLSLTLTILLLNVFSLMSFLSPHFYYLISSSLTSRLLSLPKFCFNKTS